MFLIKYLLNKIKKPIYKGYLVIKQLENQVNFHVSKNKSLIF